MRRRFPAAAFIAAAPFALVGSSAFAHDMNQSAVQRTTEMGTPPRADVKPFEQAKVSLIQQSRTRRSAWGAIHSMRDSKCGTGSRPT